MSRAAIKIHQDFDRLQRATDADYMRERFRDQLRSVREMSVEVDAFHVTRVFPRAKDAFTIQYLVTTSSDGTARTPLVFCGHLLGPDEAIPSYAEDAENRVLRFEELGLFVPVFPFDPRLKPLADLYSAEAGTAIVKDHVPAMRIGDNGSNRAECEVLGYRLEKRCVLRYRFRTRAGTSSVVVKIRRPKKSELAIDSIEMLEANGFGSGESDQLVVPHTYHVDEESGIQVMENAPGSSLHEMTSEDSFNEMCSATGRLLVKLHTVPPAGLPEYSVEHEMILLRVWVSLCGRVFPRLTGMFEAAYNMLESEVSRMPQTKKPACIHRDFYDKQVLHSGERATLIDCDNLAQGDPAQDYGNFIAHLFLRGLQEPENSANILAGVRAFEQAYVLREREFADRVRWWRAATLLRLAGLYGLRPRWRHLTEALLAEVMANDTSAS